MCIINEPPEIHFQRTTTSTPEQFVAGLIDFGPGRSKLFANSADEYLQVHYLGPSEADVTEGSGGIWERLHYNWSEPDHVVLATTDSNVWGGTSGYIYTLTRQPNGTTDIDVVIIREGKSFKGRVLTFVLRTIGRRVLERAFEKSVQAIEARNGPRRDTPHLKSNFGNEPSSEEQLAMTRGIITATDTLEIIVRPGDEGSTVCLRGRLNIDSSPALRDQLLAMIRAQSPQAVIVDFSDVSYVDSSGIATLIEGLKMARQRKTTLCLQGLQGRLLHLFEVTGMSALFENSGCGSASSKSKVS